MENSVSSKKLLIGTVASFVTLFGIGGIWHFALFPGYYFHNPDLAAIERDSAITGSIAFGELLRAFATTWLFLKIYQQGASVRNGFMFGIIAGLLVTSTVVFVNYGALKLPLSWIVMETAFTLLQGIGNGLILVLLYIKR